MESDDSTEKKPTCDAPKTLQAKTVSTLSKTQNCGMKKVCTHRSSFNIYFINLFLTLFDEFYLCVLSCVPTESQHAKADTEDGSDHSHGTVDVLVCNRPSRLAQPSVIPLVWNLPCKNVT